MKFIYLIGAFALTLTFGCNNAPQEEAKVIEKETIIVESEAPSTTVIVEEKEEAGTKVVIGPNGGSLESKDLDLEIKK